MQATALSESALALFRLHFARHGDVDVNDETRPIYRELARAGLMHPSVPTPVDRSPPIGGPRRALSGGPNFSLARKRLGDRMKGWLRGRVAQHLRRALPSGQRSPVKFRSWIAKHSPWCQSLPCPRSVDSPRHIADRQFRPRRRLDRRRASTPRIHEKSTRQCGLATGLSPTVCLPCGL